MSEHGDYIPQIKAAYPDINWDRFEDIDKALNFDLYFGTADEYFCGDTPAEVLEHYKWEGFEKASEDLKEILDPLPGEIWLDLDGDGFSSTDPSDYQGYWYYRCISCDDYHSMSKDECEDGCEFDEHIAPYWAGGDWLKIDPRKVLMFEETYKQIC